MYARSRARTYRRTGLFVGLSWHETESNNNEEIIRQNTSAGQTRERARDLRLRTS